MSLLRLRNSDARSGSAMPDTRAKVMKVLQQRPIGPLNAGVELAISVKMGTI